MSTLVSIPSTSVEAAVGASSVVIGATMAINRPVGFELWQYVSNTNSWIAQGATPVASAGAGSQYVPAGTTVILDGTNGTGCATIQDSAGGKCSLTKLMRS